MGRVEIGKRLVIPESKMAAIAMAELPDFFPNFPRPVHDASIAGKVVCPEAECLEKLLFFEKSWIGNLFRVVHKKEAKPQDFSKAVREMHNLHGKETLDFISAIWYFEKGLFIHNSCS